MSKVKRKPKLTPFEKVESFFINYDKMFFAIIIILMIMVSLLLVDVKVSLLGDDSAYLVRANKLLKEGVYPFFQGPLYPIILAGFIYILGFNVVLMKFLSLLFISGFFILTYIVFKKLIPQTALVLVLLILAINSNLSGDLFYGYPENWVNYLKMCNWTSDSLHKDAVVACRKPNLATIYSNGKNFEGIYRLTSKNPDTLLKMLSEKEVQYLIRGTLKGQIYNTIPELLNIIYNKYPKKFEVIKQIREKDPTYLVELKN